MMTPHGPDVSCFEQASNAQLGPMRVADGTQVSKQTSKQHCLILIAEHVFSFIITRDGQIMQINMRKYAQKNAEKMAKYATKYAI